MPLKELQHRVKLMVEKKNASGMGSDAVVRGEMLDWISDKQLFAFVYLVRLCQTLLIRV